MNTGSENNALVEIALALSMAFFSLMILTMVSMGAGKVSKSEKIQTKIHKMVGLTLKQVDPTPSSKSGKGVATTVQAEDLAVYFQDQLYDSQLNPLATSDLRALNIKFLAVPPDLPLRQAISLKNKFKDDQLIVTTLNATWLKTLKEKTK